MKMIPPRFFLSSKLFCAALLFCSGCGLGGKFYSPMNGTSVLGIQAEGKSDAPDAGLNADETPPVHDGDSGSNGSDNSAGNDGSGDSPALGSLKVICHLPPGNPSNAHELSVGPKAIPAHLGHGDYLGACR